MNGSRQVARHVGPGPSLASLCAVCPVSKASRPAYLFYKTECPFTQSSAHSPFRECLRLPGSASGAGDAAVPVTGSRGSQESWTRVQILPVEWNSGDGDEQSAGGARCPPTMAGAKQLSRGRGQLAF